MATRALLHISKKDELEKWLEEQGYMILALRSPWEVIRCVKDDENGKDTVIIYQKANAKEHLSVMDKDYKLIRRFIAEYKEAQKE
jgi:hypothetical protein